MEKFADYIARSDLEGKSPLLCSSLTEKDAEMEGAHQSFVIDSVFVL